MPATELQENPTPALSSYLDYTNAAIGIRTEVHRCVDLILSLWFGHLAETPAALSLACCHSIRRLDLRYIKVGII